ncbi:MAG: TIM barrel protein [bacterium]
MKLSFVIQYQDLDGLRKYTELMSSLGYEGIELGIKDPELIDREKIASILSRYRLPLIAQGTGRAFTEDGLSLSSKEIKIREASIKRLKAHIDLASSFSSFVIVGLIRGNIQEETQQGYVRETLRGLCDYARTKDVKILLEPINRYEINWINTVEEAYNFIMELERDNIGLLIDTFHMNIEEPSIAGSIFKARQLIWHLHIADSNRLTPALGHIDFKDIFRILDSIGYSGFVSSEIITRPSLEEAISQTARYVRNIM